ncbi:MAG TPA: hypothetical protein VFD58_01025 [Blastocatellia bacterium]|nr:hypothetical protein [Blastocatellia bacterium]
MRITNRAGLAAEALTALESGLPEHGTLMEVVKWGNSQRPPVRIADVIIQDEYTHDIIVPWRDGLTLVYGTT